MEALRNTHGNVSQAARDLGVSWVTLHDKLKKYELEKGTSSLRPVRENSMSLELTL